MFGNNPCMTLLLLPLLPRYNCSLVEWRHVIVIFCWSMLWRVRVAILLDVVHLGAAALDLNGPKDPSSVCLEFACEFACGCRFLSGPCKH
jgi:hypothetical protein